MVDLKINAADQLRKKNKNKTQNRQKGEMHVGSDDSHSVDNSTELHTKHDNHVMLHAVTSH